MHVTSILATIIDLRFMLSAPRSKVDNLVLQHEVDEYLAELPLTSPIRDANPNLHPMESDLEDPTPRLRRRKPSFPVPVDVSNSVNSLSFVQKFWKFHLVKFANDMYLTTNPTPRHLHCRSFPGYYIAVDGNPVDYTLSFEEIETGIIYLRIRKHSTKEGEFFRYKLRRMRRLEEGKLVKDAETTVYENFVRREVIPLGFLPIPPEFPLTSYQTKDFNEKLWSVGAIPRLRASRLNASESKYVGKHNVYFHNNFGDKYPITDIPPVKAVFRPDEVSVKKRVIRSLNRLLKIDDSSKVSLTDMYSVYSDVRSFFKADDGLYNLHPSDDDPDKNTKYGWLTVYEDAEFFLQSGMFDLVVGLSIAVSYEHLLSDDRIMRTAASTL